MSDSNPPGKKGGGASGGDRDRGRPFYELPAHIKPCSRIIQETRLQLSSHAGAKSAPFTRTSNSSLQDRFSSAPPSHSHQHHYYQQQHHLSAGGGDTLPGFYQDTDSNNHSSSIRSVQTQRPKTGTDHDSAMLWGVSSRKRPPSAITLSRLSLDDNYDDQNQSELSNYPSTITNQYQSQQPRLGLGSLQHIQPHHRYGHGHGHGPLGAMSGSSLDSALPNQSQTHLQSTDSPGGERPNTTKAKGTKTKKKTKSHSMDVNVHGSEEDTTITVDDEEQSFRAALVDAVEHLRLIVENQSESKAGIIEALQRVKKGLALLKYGEFGGSLRQRLLRSIFRLVESNQGDEDVVFWASFVLLHCNIVGNNLTTVFKMVFKASRWKEYWTIIANSEYLDVFMDSFARICPLTQTESMIYGYGTLKFISMDKDVLLRVLQLDLIPIMALHLKLVNYELDKKYRDKDKDENNEEDNDKDKDQEKIVKVNKPKGISESIYNAAFQLTSILRSVVGEESSLPEVVRTGLLTELCNSLWWTFEDIDVLSNIVRILSVVSSGDSDCCGVISANETFVHSIVDMLDMWDSKEDIVVRLTYTLGNLLAHSEHMRIKLFQQPGCYHVILHLITFYLDALKQSLAHHPNQKSPMAMAEDILIKSIRILANWSLNPVIGQEIASDDDVLHILNAIIAQDEDTAASSNKHSDELLMCVMSTLNNVTFYKDYCTTADVDTSLETAHNLCPFLSWTHIEGRTEVMKVLGNLTRNPVIRKWIGEEDSHVDELIKSLGVSQSQSQVNKVKVKGEEELVSATLGVLMNIIVDRRACGRFLRNRGIHLLLELLQSADNNQVGLVLMICQFIWNIHISTSISCAGNWKNSGTGTGTATGTDNCSEEGEEDPLAPVTVAVGGRDGGNDAEGDGAMSIKQRLEIRGILKRKLRALEKLELGPEMEGEEFELLEELKSVGGRLYDKLGE